MTLWPLAVQHASLCQRMGSQGRRITYPPWGSRVSVRIKDQPSAAFAARSREGYFVGGHEDVTHGMLVARLDGDKWLLEVTSTVLELPKSEPAEGAPAEAGGGGGGGASGGDED